jgi:hypothetical protein
MKGNLLKALWALGQSILLDYMRRGLIIKNELYISHMLGIHVVETL